MAGTDMESMMKQFLGGKQNPSMNKGLESVMSFINSEEGRRLAKVINSENTDTLMAIIQAAMRKDEKAAKAALEKLMATPEGKEFIEKMTAALAGGK